MQNVVRVSLAIALYVPQTLSSSERPPQSASPPVAPANQSKLQGHLRQAAEKMHAGDLAAAEKELRSALALDPNSLAALNNLGIVLAREGRLAEAIPLYQVTAWREPRTLQIGAKLRF